MGFTAKDIKKAQAADLHPKLLWFRHLRGKIGRLRIWAKSGFRKTDSDRLATAVERAARKSDWTSALAVVSQWAEKAQRTDDRELLERAGNDMRRLGELRRSFELTAKAKAQGGPKEWDGTDLTGKSIVVERREGDYAIFFQFISAIDLAIRQCGKCTVLVEERMAPLYERTFPGADIRLESKDRAEAVGAADWVTSFESLAFHLRWDGIQSTTLKPDLNLVRQLRLEYRSNAELPIHGISWGSINKYKDAPGIDDWIRMIRATKGRFISLQYGDVSSVMKTFESTVPGRIFTDPTVDQLVDMDRFAAQVASLDTVVTISNTVAHLAGALGVKTIVLLDGKFKRTWPAFGRDVACYKRVVLLRRSSRRWNGVIEQAVAEMEL